MDEATEHKHVLEERQRAQERQRSANNTPWTPTYFSKEVQFSLPSPSPLLLPPVHYLELETYIWDTFGIQLCDVLWLN